MEASGNFSRLLPHTTAASGLSANSFTPRSIQPSATSQSPSRNITNGVSGAISMSLSKPALRPRAAVNGRLMSSSTTSTPIDLAMATLPSVEPEST